MRITLASLQYRSSPAKLLFIKNRSTDCKYWTMRMMNDSVGNASKKIFFYCSHTLSTNHDNIYIVFLGIINYCFFDCIRFFDDFFFYIYSLFPYQRIDSIKYLALQPLVLLLLLSPVPFLLLYRQVHRGLDQ